MGLRVSKQSISKDFPDLKVLFLHTEQVCDKEDRGFITKL